MLFLNAANQNVRYIELKYPEYVPPGTCYSSVLTLSTLMILLGQDVLYGGNVLIICRQFNAGSPWNVSAGQGGGNIDAVIAKYEQEAFADNERKLQQIRDNNVPAEKPVQRLVKSPPATPSA